MADSVPEHIAPRRAQGGGRRLKKRKRNAKKAQEIALMNRDDYEEDSSGSESDEWYEGDEHDEYAFNEGGYFKTKPGDTLNKRYQIRKRVGWGHFSQVYLANDKQENKHVAVKILKTGEDYVTAGEEERSYHEAINKIEIDPSESYVCRMLDCFDIYSNRGKHISMVFERMSLSIFELLNFDEEEPGFPLGVVKQITKEVLEGLVEIHSANLVHTDLKPENLMLGPIEEVNLDECERYRALYEFRETQKDLELCQDKLEKGGLNKNQKKRLKQRIAKLEKKVTENQHILAEEEDNQEDEEYEQMRKALTYMGTSVCEDGKAHVKICDLGTACFADEKNNYEIGTRNYRGPECILGIRFTQAIDIWAVACMVVELLDGEVLFDPDEEDEDEEFDNEMRNSVHLKQIMEALGKIPKHMISREYFNRKNELLLIEKVEEKGLIAVLQEKVCSLDEDDLEELCAFLLPMLEIDPKKRPTAITMLKHPWLTVSSTDKTEIAQWVEDLNCDDLDDDEEEE